MNRRCPHCRAMRRRLISIARGCNSVEELPNDEEHDDLCVERDLILNSIYSIAVGKHNWPKALPYKPLTDKEVK